MIFITGDATCIATLNLKRPYLSCRFAKEKKIDLDCKAQLVVVVYSHKIPPTPVPLLHHRSTSCSI
jgi:hypothetical protein